MGVRWEPDGGLVRPTETEGLPLAFPAPSLTGCWIE